MMKLKKLLAAALSALMLIGLLAACGGTPNTPSNASNPGTNPGANNPGSGTTENTKTYQFYGVYEESGENASMLNAAFLLNLNSDGTAVADKYMFSNYDASDAATNPTFTASYMSGTWKEVQKDGVDCLQIKLAYVDDAGNESNAQTAYSYDVAGVYSFDMTFPVVPGMSYTRIAPMEGKEGKTYTDANAFIQAYKQEFTAPEHVGTFTDADHNGTAYLQEDGNLLLYAGYDKFAEGKWSKTDSGISVSVNGEALDVTMNGNQASFGYSRSLDGTNTVDYTFVCADITAFAAPEVGEDTPYTVSIDMGGNVSTAELVLHDDGTAAFKMFTDFTCTYEKVGSAVVLSVQGELEGYAAQIWPNVSHAYILNDDHSMTILKNAWSADSLALLALDDTNLKVEFPAYHMERDGFTYVLSEDGTQLTVTAPGEDVLGAFGQIWAGAGAEKWTIDGNTATKAE